MDFTSRAIAYCRPGFEKDLAAEFAAKCAKSGVAGQSHSTPDCGFVLHEFDAPLEEAQRVVAYDQLVFARQLIWVRETIDDLPEKDRLTPLMAAIGRLHGRFGRVWAETPDTNEAKTLSSFFKRFMPILESALHDNKRLFDRPDAPNLHLFFTSPKRVFIGTSDPSQASPWPMGIARLRMPREAPSRSTLKLAEAFFGLLSEDERKSSLRAGLKAVDLGAAPGGWTWQFAHRGLLVTAIDNGTMAESVRATGMVEHIRADGFVWKPPRPVEWMVCDMVEQPSRVAQLVAEWVASGRCRRTMFNLKLPMKKRHEALEQARNLIYRRMSVSGRDWTLRFKHLYHDREEITGYLAATK
ncbi:23S rRNA (cytidine(2498)-2'-O)-methyltransferase RlmM [Niveibacterium sp. 24ML]|uniref:23S rRNA (cytidine(2498)-2'-O)-methyltransferase RlmM n=1 Tax=Niveibacterium sp. 24ML TaxID=2985512 RepID=UPI00226F2AA0|nr:23S rRNA (cytidine(2498)-2'-O)-methyltransferase RlmM [Niveibacterium sp. 24ML]MCX9155287.1 23S rRNA (cytidine(2498)-2'-O)-methyltransferase RlmM [Niveibacterium sp. 24ML]